MKSQVFTVNIRVLRRVEPKQKMYSVRVLLCAGKLAQNMREIQLWLDQVGFGVKRYTYGMEETGPLIEVDIGFPRAEEAEIFCVQFDGELLSQETCGSTPASARNPAAGQQ